MKIKNIIYINIMQVYISKKCPHCLSLLEILSTYNSFVDPSKLEILDVHDRKSTVPRDVIGVPAICYDEKYYFGDYAFNLLDKMHSTISKREIKGGVISGDLNFSRKNSLIEKKQSEEQGAFDISDKQVDDLFNCDPIATRQ
jgi:hypothetical protein